MDYSPPYSLNPFYLYAMADKSRLSAERHFHKSKTALMMSSSFGRERTA